jgi:hypothetical protein
VHVPFDLLRWKAAKPGYVTVYTPGGSDEEPRFTLPPERVAEPGMVWVPGGLPILDSSIAPWIPEPSRIACRSSGVPPWSS